MYTINIMLYIIYIIICIIYIIHTLLYTLLESKISLHFNFKYKISKNKKLTEIVF